MVRVDGVGAGCDDGLLSQTELANREAEPSTTLSHWYQPPLNMPEVRHVNIDGEEKWKRWGGHMLV